MKKFTFPLARVLDWRRTQVVIEEGKLGRLQAELNATEERIAAARRAREESQRNVLSANSMTGAELAALDDFMKASMVESRKLERSAAEARKGVSAQVQIVILRRRDALLLETLHDRKQEAWNLELDKVIDLEAGELHLAALAQKTGPRRLR